MQQAFEFQTTAQDGFIRIPDIYAKIMPRKIKVIAIIFSVRVCKTGRLLKIKSKS